MKSLPDSKPPILKAETLLNSALYLTESSALERRQQPVQMITIPKASSANAPRNPKPSNHSSLLSLPLDWAARRDYAGARPQ